MKFDLKQLGEHPLKFRPFVPHAVVMLGGKANAGRCELTVQWKSSASEAPQTGPLEVSWDVETLRPLYPVIDEELEIVRTRDSDRTTQVENAAVVIAVAVMANLEPQTRFTYRPDTGNRHDYYLNETNDEMIEIAGRWVGGLPGLFEQKRKQSDLNPTLRKRWVSVTIFQRTLRNRTEGLHS